MKKKQKNTSYQIKNQKGIKSKKGLLNDLADESE